MILDTGKIQKVAQEKLEEILQGYAFVFGESLGSCEQDAVCSCLERFSCAQCDTLLVEMQFSGYSCGNFKMVMSSKMSAEVTANILGYEASDPFVVEHFEDGAKEILNIIGAHVITTVAGADKSIDIAIPHSRKLNDSEWLHLCHAKTRAGLMVEETPVLLITEFIGE